MGTTTRGFTSLTSQVVPLPVNNIDTDQIIPARFLKTTDKLGLGAALFCDWRYAGEVPDLNAAAEAVPKPGFSLNQEKYRGAQVLLAGDNFGCGSSREHAPWALVGWGFRAVISTSFADIFRSNALKNSLLPVMVDEKDHRVLMRLTEADCGLTVTVDLPTQTVRFPGGHSIGFPIDSFAKRCLVEGVDQLGYLVRHELEISAFEEAR